MTFFGKRRYFLDFSTCCFLIKLVSAEILLLVSVIPVGTSLWVSLEMFGWFLMSYGRLWGLSTSLRLTLLTFVFASCFRGHFNEYELSIFKFLWTGRLQAWRCIFYVILYEFDMVGQQIGRVHLLMTPLTAIFYWNTIWT